MPEFVLSTDIHDDDWDALFAICWKAFKDAPEIRIMYPGGLDPTYRARNVAMFKAGASRGAVEGYLAKITETESGKITSYITGRIYDGPLGVIDGDLAKPQPPVKLPFIDDRSDREWYEWYWGQGRSIMRGIKELQAPHVYIQGLCTDPAWQRHGAATLLMNWATGELARSKKIGRCVLTASPSALKARFYENFGFQVIYTHDFADEERFPGRVGAPMIVMTNDK